jgi:hypothetical protein
MSLMQSFLLVAQIKKALDPGTRIEDFIVVKQYVVVPDSVHFKPKFSRVSRQ